MINNYKLLNYLDELLDSKSFSDYCPNGLQVEGVADISHITVGVSLSDALIEKAIQNNSQAILVHHGIFWNKDSYVLTGVKKRRIEKLIKNNLNLYAYHLPLDNHSTLGNNAQLGQILGIEVQNQTGYQNLIWYGKLKEVLSLAEFSNKINEKLLRQPLVLGNSDRQIEKIAWCTGGADSFFNDILDLDIDLYITGEASEPTMALALESGITYISAGHYATERYGVQAVANQIKEKFEVITQYEEIYNPV